MRICQTVLPFQITFICFSLPTFLKRWLGIQTNMRGKLLLLYEQGNVCHQLHGPSEMPSLQDAFQSSSVFVFYPTDYGTIYGPGPSSRQAIDHQDFTCALPGASESSGSSQSLSPGTAGAQDDSRANSKRWDSAEVKILVAAYKAYNNDLKSAKSSRGKKAIWEKNLRRVYPSL